MATATTGDVDALTVTAIAAPHDATRRKVLADAIDELGSSESAVAAAVRSDKRGPGVLIATWKRAQETNVLPDYRVLWAVVTFSLDKEPAKAARVTPAPATSPAPTPTPVEEPPPFRRRDRRWVRPFVRPLVGDGLPESDDGLPWVRPLGDTPLPAKRRFGRPGLGESHYRAILERATQPKFVSES
jgi:hypothetical protein